MYVIDLLMKQANPRFHGNGFTQVYLAPDTQLHVWHRDLPPLDNHNASIHNHQYDLQSTVYNGTLQHTTYDVDTDAPREEHNASVVSLGGPSGTSRAPDMGTIETCKLTKRHVYHLQSGSLYTMRRPFFHSSVHVYNDPVVTIFSRTNKGTEFAKVVTGIGDAVATDAFPPGEQPSLSRMWTAIEHGLHEAGSGCRARVVEILRTGGL